MRSLVDVVLPVFAIILTGYLAGWRGLLGPASSDALNRFVYYLALPVLMFHALAKVRPAEIFDASFLAAYLGGIALVGAGSMMLALWVFNRPTEDASVFAMATTFGNTGYMGIPLSAAAFGPEAALPATILTVFAGAVLVAVVTLGVELGLSAHGRPFRHVTADICLALAKNPLIVAPTLGIAWSLAGLPVWAPLDRFCGILGAAAGPCALVAIGLFLVGKPMAADPLETAAMVALKLLAQPLVTAWLALAVFDVDPLWASVAILLAALPTGANVFVLARRYDVYVDRVSAATLLSTVAAVLTLSVLFAFPGWQAH